MAARTVRANKTTKDDDDNDHEDDDDDDDVDDVSPDGAIESFVRTAPH